MDEVTPRTIGAEPNGVERPAQLRLVLGVPAEGPELRGTMGELALVAVLAETVFLEGPAQLRLVPRRVPALHRLGVTAVQTPMLTTATTGTATATDAAAATVEPPDHAQAQCSYGRGVPFGEAEVAAHCPLVDG